MGEEKLNLTLDRVLLLALKWERAPLSDAQSFADGETEIVIARDLEIVAIKKLPGFAEKPLKFFDHAPGWQDAEIAILDQIKSQTEAELQTNQPTGENLKSLEDKLNQVKTEREQTGKRQDGWKNEYSKWYKLNKERGREEAWSDEAAGNVADQILASENMEADSPEQSSLQSSQRVQIQQQASQPARQVLSATRPSSSFIESVRSEQPGSFGMGSWLRHPISTFKNWWGKRAAGQVASKVAGTAAKKAVAGTVAKGLATKGAAALAGGAATGGVATVLMLAKELLTNKDLQNMLKDLVSKGSIAVAGLGFLIWNFLGANFIGAGIGAFLGGAFGILGGPIGIAAGSFGGALMGAQIQAALFGGGGIFGGGSVGIASAGGASTGGMAAAPTASISVGGFTIPAGLSSAASSFGAVLSGSGIPTITLVGIGGGIGALLLSVTLTMAAVLQTSEEKTPLGQSTGAIFTLKKEAITPEFTDYEEGPITISYKLIIQAGKNPVSVESITDKLTRTNSSKWSRDVPVPTSQNKEISYNVVISGAEFKDTYLYNSATVKVKDTVTGQEETKTASTKVKIGSPPIENFQPFGYPASGVITTLDAEIFDTDGHVHSSCFMNFSPCRWFNGGMDIAPRGGDPTVYSTMEGDVIKKEFVRSNNVTGDVGGVVYVKNGPYIAEFMHLDESVTNLPAHVNRGDSLGKIYPGSLSATTGPHVHYQVLFNGSNLFFNDQKIIGKCSQDKILPDFPVHGGPAITNSSHVCE